MLLLRACMLWALVSGNVVGAAFLFRRWFPRESPWLGFVIPELLFVLICNFLEHQISLGFLPVVFLAISLAGLWTVVNQWHLWRVLRLPSVIFMSVFAFTLLLRVLRPSIVDVRDGIPDLSLISAFCMGQTLPVESTWIPPVLLVHYYFLEHYAASLVTRLLSLDVGTGFNVCAALLSAYIYFFTAGVAWHLSRGRLGIVIGTVALTACAGNGASGYLWLTVKNLDPEDTINLYTRLEDPNVHLLLWKFLTPIGTWNRHELMVPGYWGWMGAYHSAAAGQLLMGFTILALVELIRPKQTNGPWICLAIIPLLMLTCCSWGMPLAVLFFLAGLFVCWRRKIRPEDWRIVVLVPVAAAVCMEPMLSYLFLWHAPAITLATGLHTQVAEFLVLWWPVYVPGIALAFIWKKLHPVTQIALVLTPVGFALVETFNVGQRYDTTSKMWGMIYGAAWMTVIPTLAAQRDKVYRTIVVLVTAASIFSLGFWVDHDYDFVRVDDIGHLEGTGPFRWELRKAKILEAVSQMKHQTVITGKSSWAFNDSSSLAHFTLNRSYVSWSVFADDGFYSNGMGEGWKREVPVNDLYDGKNDNPLLYLRQRNIAALVIYPDDNIADAVVEQLKAQLAPYYHYEDYRDGDPLTPPNAGVFIYHPELASFPPGVLTPPAANAPAVDHP